LLDCKYSHVKTVIVIYIFSVVTIGSSILTYFFNVPTYSLLTVVTSGLIFLFIVMNLNKRKTRVRLTDTRA
jgi:hypothetical protein